MFIGKNVVMSVVSALVVLSVTVFSTTAHAEMQQGKVIGKKEATGASLSGTVWKSSDAKFSFHSDGSLEVADIFGDTVVGKWSQKNANVDIEYPIHNGAHVNASFQTSSGDRMDGVNIYSYDGSKDKTYLDRQK